MPDQTFTNSFSPHNYNHTPVFAFGINGYSLGDRFFSENFQAVSTSVTASQFGITVASVGPTNIKIFSVSFMAVWEPSGFATYSYSFSSVSFSIFRQLTSVLAVACEPTLSPKLAQLLSRMAVPFLEVGKSVVAKISLLKPMYCLE